MFDIFSGLHFWLGFSLVLALAFVLAFEFINGFHDTANAVAMAISTKAMPPHLAVSLSGIFNFFGVLMGGVGVAYAIVHLLPVEMLVNVDTARGLIMVFSMLAAAIAWNLGTWYFGIPASSSHTLIGSILGVGMANAWLTHTALSTGVNWSKAAEIGLSLVISPITGFALAGFLLWAAKRWMPDSKMHKTPEQRREVDGKKHPPFWHRLVLVLSAMGLSFVHGSNDGQKGIGLIMLVLIGIVPGKFVLDVNASSYDIDYTRNAAIHLTHFFERDAMTLEQYLAQYPQRATDGISGDAACDPRKTPQTTALLIQDLAGIDNYRQLDNRKRIDVRHYLLCLDNTAKNLAGMKGLPSSDRTDVLRIRKDLTATTEYAPFWVIAAVALALGLGTVVGWRRVVETVSEKIGKQGITYAQAMAAQLTAVASIGMANVFSLPVSTTHVLSSGVAGTVVANRSGLQRGTARNIVLAWVLTLPAAMILAAGLFILGMKLV
ncbi:inorganic phosphate transporter [Paralcaligenes sp. KSB-10]|uniref:inorganic phosphate transporter n=1 Tax=Paralcaligenes sp. KSB-10 TaxID=2901142 RepID=UPI001E44262C|nr:inorganic phosphate transporter [Paralcaligenes sp. KSB-10]UHL65073.1 inorganic phosphate transporter [Paralcaligenes sp. KSB-10]